MTLIDRDFLKEVAPNVVMTKMASPVSVKGVRPRKHSLVDYATINLYFPANKHCTTAVHQKVHVAKMLIGINILSRESVTIDTRNKRSTIGSGNNIVIHLEVAPQSQTQFPQQILANKDMTIPAKILDQILVQSKLPEGKDLLFKPL